MKNLMVISLLLIFTTLTLHSQLQVSMTKYSATEVGVGNTVEGIFQNLRKNFGEMGFKDIFNHLVNEQIEDIFDEYIMKRGNDDRYDFAKDIDFMLKKYTISFVMNKNLYVLSYNPVELPHAFLENGIIERHLILYGLDETGEWFEATDLIKTDERKGKSYMSAFFPFQFNYYSNQPYSYVKKLEEENIVVMYVLYHEFDERPKGNNIDTARPYYEIITLKPKNNREFTFKKETDWDVKKYIITE